MSELIKKWSEIINQFTKRNINTKSEKFYDASEKIKEDVIEQNPKEESDQSFLNWVKVSEERFNLIKQIINKNRDLDTTINIKRYTLNDADVLVNKIAKNEIRKDKTIKVYNTLVKKAEQIAKLRPTPPRQKMLVIFGYMNSENSKKNEFIN